MNRITKTFLAGVVVAVPIIIVVYVVCVAGVGLNNLAVEGAKSVSPKLGEVLEAVPGLGIVVILLLIFLVGLAARFWLTARLFALVEFVFERVPLVKTLYTAVRDMLRFVGGGSGSKGKVVLYKVPGADVRMLAILTNDRPAGLPDPQAESMVAIWLPMSYMLGGYMLYVPADAVEPLDMSVEEVMKLTATAEFGAEALPESKEGA